MEIKISSAIGFGVLLSYLLPGMLVVVVATDRNTKGFIWTISIYFSLATILYIVTAFKLFYNKKTEENGEATSTEKGEPRTTDCPPPTYTEVTETPPPYSQLPKKYQKSSSKLRRELSPSRQDPHQKFTPEFSTLKRLAFRSKSLITNSTYAFTSKRHLLPLKPSVSVPLS